MNLSYITSAGSVLPLYLFLRVLFWEHYILIIITKTTHTNVSNAASELW